MQVEIILQCYYYIAILLLLLLSSLFVIIFFGNYEPGYKAYKMNMK